MSDGDPTRPVPIRLWRTWAANLLIMALLVLASGCQLGTDDEMVPPARTVTASPSPRVTIAPTAVPVGGGQVSPSVAVWAQDSTLHFGPNEVSLFPRMIDSLVVVRGGVFLLDRGQVWFTDLVRVRDTGLRDVTELVTNRDASALLVTRTTSSGTTEQLAYDLADGSATEVAGVTPVTVADLLGRSVRVRLRSVVNAPGTPSVLPSRPARLGPGRYGVLAEPGARLVAFASATRGRIPLEGVLGNGFELIRWTSDVGFYGVAHKAGRPVAIIKCDVERRRCSSLGDVVPNQMVVFETGT